MAPLIPQPHSSLNRTRPYLLGQHRPPYDKKKREGSNQNEVKRLRIGKRCDRSRDAVLLQTESRALGGAVPDSQRADRPTANCDHQSALCAIICRCSQMCVPGTLDRIEPNPPTIPLARVRLRVKHFVVRGSARGEQKDATLRTTALTQTRGARPGMQQTR